MLLSFERTSIEPFDERKKISLYLSKEQNHFSNSGYDSAKSWSTKFSVLLVSLERLCSMFLALCVFYLKLRILHPGDNRCSMQLYYCTRLILYQGEKDQFLRTMSLRDTKFPFFKALIFDYCLHLWKTLSNLV